MVRAFCEEVGDSEHTKCEDAENGEATTDERLPTENRKIFRKKMPFLCNSVNAFVHF